MDCGCDEGGVRGVRGVALHDIVIHPRTQSHTPQHEVHVTEGTIRDTRGGVTIYVRSKTTHVTPEGQKTPVNGK